MKSGYVLNIEEETIKNTDYRRVLYTTDQNQLVLMSILPGEDIPCEIHPNITQFIRIEKGNGVAYIGKDAYELKDGIALDIPPGTYHQIINTSETEDLKLYTIYSPPEHPKYLIQKTKPTERKIKKNKLNRLVSFYLFL